MNNFRRYVAKDLEKNILPPFLTPQMNMMEIFEVGSTSWGINTDESGDDLDLMGIHLNNIDELIGITKRKDTITYRTRAEGVRSQVGDIDFVSHSLHKFLNLCLKGNPNVLAFFYTSSDNFWYSLKTRRFNTSLFSDFNTEWLYSKKVAKHTMAYARNQLDSLIKYGGYGGSKVKRPELVERYGFDTKYAGHIARLVFAVEAYMKEGRFYIPLKEHERETVKNIRKGRVHLQTFVVQYKEHLDYLNDYMNYHWDAPKEPNTLEVNKWIKQIYLERFKYDVSWA